MNFVTAEISGAGRPAVPEYDPGAVCVAECGQKGVCGISSQELDKINFFP